MRCGVVWCDVIVLVLVVAVVVVVVAGVVLIIMQRGSRSYSYSCCCFAMFCFALLCSFMILVSLRCGVWCKIMSYHALGYFDGAFVWCDV